MRLSHIISLWISWICQSIFVCSASEGAYNDDDMGSGEEEEEGEGHDEDILQCSDRNADGICHFVKPQWRSVSADDDTSPYSDQPRVENNQPR